MTLRLALAALLTAVTLACRSTTPLVDDITPGVDAARALMQRPDVATAFGIIDAQRESTLALWRELTAIPAPSGHEAARAQRVEELLREAGLQPMRDGAGNVVAKRAGSGGGAHVVFDAHLDTVFPLDTDVVAVIEEGRIRAPGVGDNTRNVVALIAMARAMNEAAVVTRGDVTFLFTVEEETTFDGVDHYLAENKGHIDQFVTLDGGYGDFTYAAIGIYWDRYRFHGPGGHTRSSVPPYSAAVPVGRAIVRISALALPQESHINVAMLGAGDVFNAKASEAWFSVDVRSNDQATLDRLDREVRRIVNEEAARVGMTVTREEESRRVVASLSGHRSSAMVKTTQAVFRAFDFEPLISDAASNHTSAALTADIPAIGTGSAPCERSHSPDESCAIEPLFTGIRRNLVLAIALTDHPPRGK